jgi:AcrR family transcriptional regulator
MGRPPTITREQLFDTARRVFSEKGFEATTLADIARELGVTPAAVLRPLRSKQALFATARRAAAAGLRAAGLHHPSAGGRRLGGPARRAAEPGRRVRPLRAEDAGGEPGHLHAPPLADVDRPPLRRARRRFPPAARPRHRHRLLPARGRGRAHPGERPPRRRPALHGIAAVIRAAAPGVQRRAAAVSARRIPRRAHRSLDKRSHWRSSWQESKKCCRRCSPSSS